MYRISWAPSAYHYTLALLGAMIYRFPSREITVIGVTGTKGKTTTIELINAILEAAGEKTVLVSSIRFKLHDKSEVNKTGNTQPGRFFIQYFLREAVKKGCRYAIIEVGSEGVVMHRHRFIDFDVAVFTGIHPEHIESHGGFENYLKAKLSFFRYVKRRSKKKNTHFIINGEDKHSDKFIEVAGADRVSSYSMYSGPLKLIGDFNRRNAAAAEAVCRALGVDEHFIEKALRDFEGVEGRMEFLQREPFSVLIDYAHTPDSLEEVYGTLRKNLSGRLICVLGSMGGGRDRWKRPEFGRIAGKHCGEIILTNEDPVDEPPEKIISEIETGIGLDTGSVHKIVDRREAIQKAISLARPGDAVVITGKGREPYIRVANGKRIPWSDADAVRSALTERKL